jgi:hypothetical protein
MGDGDDGAARGEPLEGGLDFVLGLGIERAGGLIEKEDGSVLEKGAGDGQPLLLAAGDEAALVTDDGLVALGLGEDEIVRECLAGGVVDLLVGGIEAAVADVLEDGLVEEEGVLADDADVLAQRFLGDRADVAPSMRMVPLPGS